MAQVISQEQTHGRVDTQFVQKNDIGKVYGGTVIDGNATVSEALNLSGLDWNVHKEQVTRKGLPIEGKYHIVRNDTDTSLSIVGNDYEPIQNSKAFEFVEKIVGNEARITTAGSLKGGLRSFVCVDFGGMDITPGDEVRKYGVFINSFDGIVKFMLRLSGQRLACQNQLDAIMENNEDKISIKHTKSANIHLIDAERILKLASSKFSVLQRDFQRFAKTRVDNDEMRSLVMRFLGVTDEDIQNSLGAERAPGWIKKSQQIVEAVRTSPGSDIKGVEGSLWAVYNGMTYWLDHVSTVKNTSYDKVELETSPLLQTELRAESKLFGAIGKEKQRALEVCTSFAYAS